MAKNNRWFAFVGVFVLSMAPLLHSENPAPTSAPPSAQNADALVEVLQVLQAKGMLTAEEFETLKQRALGAKQQDATPATAQAPQEKAKNVVTAMDTGVGIRVGEVDVRFSGEFNAFYVHDRSTKSVPAGVLTLASTSAVPNSSIRNGLLPGNFTINVSTRQRGMDIGVTFGFWPGIQSLQSQPGGVNLSPGNPTGFGVAGIDFRQQFLTISKAHVGTFKFGRDIGFFGQEGILNDMTLLGAGTTNGNVAPGSVTLGRIGLGYIYTDFIPQISYTTPTSHGFQAGIGVFEPLSDVIPTTLGLTQFAAPLTGHGQPQFQGKLTYTTASKGPANLKLWTNFITQSLEANLGEGLASIPVGENVRGSGIDLGGKLTVKGFDLVGYGYKGWGLGTEGLYFLAASPTGATRDSQGYYAQGTYTFKNKVTLGASYGLSHLFLASGDGPALASPLTKSNSSYVGQMRYGLTKWVNLVGEYTHTISEAHNQVRTTSDSVALGTILFF